MGIEMRCRSASTILRHVWPKMDPALEGATQKTPFNVNRFVLLIISIIYTSTSACVYFNWNSVREILYDAGVYAELNVGTVEDKTNSIQYQTINNLFPITLAIHFTTSVFCGFLYDHIGPKFTASLGQLFNILCWIFLSINTTAFNSTLIGFVFMGLGADTAFIPVLTIANLFPDASTFILTLIGAAASLSFAVPVVLNLIIKNVPGFNFTRACILYICVILLPCLLVSLFLFPLKPFKGVDDYEREKKNINIDNIEDAPKYTENVKMEGHRTQEQSTNENMTQTNETVMKETNGNIVERMEKIEVEDALHILSRRGSGSKVHLKPKNELENVVDEDQTYVNEKNYVQTEKDLHLKMNGVNDKEINAHFHWASVKLFLKLLITFPSICVITYFIIFNISMVLYGLINETYFDYDPSIITILNILFPLSCIPCIIFGRIVNRFGAAVVIIMMNASSLLMHLTALLKYKVSGIFSVIFYTFATSMYTSQIYCFIQNTFPTIVFGKFIGFTSLCGGVFSLLTQPIYNRIIPEEGVRMDPTKVAYTLIISFLILFIPLTILKIKNYETVPELNNNQLIKDSAADTRKEEDYSTI